MDDPTIPGDQAPAPDRTQINVPPQDFTERLEDAAVDRDDEQTSEDVQPSTSADSITTSAVTRTIRTITTSTRETATSSALEEELTSTSESSVERSSTRTTSSTTEESTSLPRSSSTVETSELTSAESTTSSEITTTSSEISTSSETTPTTRPPRPTRVSPEPSPSKTVSKGASKDDGLGTGTTIGIVLAAFVGVSILLIVLGALLKWRRRRLIAKKSEGLPAFKTILDFADTNGIDAANEKAAKETSTVPVTPPYRPEVRQAQKRNSWGDDQQALDDSGGGGEDYTFQRADSQRGRAGPPFSYVNPVTYGEGARRAQTMDDRSIDYNMPGYAGQTDYGLARFPSQLRPGGYGDQRGGAFDAVHGQYGYNDYYRQNERAAPPVRNRHFPVTPGRAYTADNPYPFVPTGHR